jgi:formylglycine-generating enzyme required for sulfatase activity
VNRVLGVDPDDERARLLLGRYQEARAAKEKEALDALDRAAIDEALTRATDALAESVSLKNAADERLKSGEGEKDSFMRDISAKLAISINESARRKAAAAGGLFVQALTLRTETRYRHEEIERRAAETFFGLFLDAAKSNDPTFAEWAGAQALQYNRGRDPEIDRAVVGNSTLTLRCGVEGATAHLFKYEDVTEAGLPYSFRRVPVPQPATAGEGAFTVLGGFESPNWETLRLGSLDVATADEIARALETPGEPAPIARDDAVFEVCRLTSANIEAAPIRMGSYLLVVRAPGYDEMRLPFLVRRNEPVTLVSKPIEKGGVPDEFAYVPAGVSIVFGSFEGMKTSYTADEARKFVGGFLLARREVTEREYAEFVNALAARDPAEALKRVPTFPNGPAWEIPEPGRPWVPKFPNWPVNFVSAHHAEAYCDWLTEKKGGLKHRLPTEEEWERAARGADGRGYPWGDFFLPQFCRMERSRPEAEADNREPGGRFLADRSVFGIEDMAGLVSEFTSPGEQQHKIQFARGGNFRYRNGSTCSTTIRLVRDSLNDRHQGVGFRVARDL